MADGEPMRGIFSVDHFRRTRCGIDRYHCMRKLGGTPQYTVAIHHHAMGRNALRDFDHAYERLCLQIEYCDAPVRIGVLAEYAAAIDRGEHRLPSGDSTISWVEAGMSISPVFSRSSASKNCTLSAVFAVTMRRGPPDRLLPSALTFLAPIRNTHRSRSSFFALSLDTAPSSSAIFRCRARPWSWPAMRPALRHRHGAAPRLGVALHVPGP